MLTGAKGLAKTSGSPGKTQMINHFALQVSNGTTPAGATVQQQSIYFVDLPGYGYAKVSQTRRAGWSKMIEEYLRERKTLIAVFVLIDSRHNPQEADLDFLRKLGEWQVPFNMIFTKADKTTQREAGLNARLFITAMKEDWEFIPRSFMSSAVKNTGRKEILNYISELNELYEQEQAGSGTA
jgi:GTP-binding protein